MSLQRNLALDDGDHSLKLHIEARRLARLLCLAVTSGLEEQLAEHRRYRHSGHGRFLAVLTVYALWILAKGALHRHGILDYHIVNAATDELYCRKCSANNVGTAGTCTGRGNSALDRKTEGLVNGVNAVDGAHMRSDRIRHLVVVSALPTHRGVVNSDMAMSLNASGSNKATCGVDNRRTRDLDLTRADLGDLAVIVDQHVAAVNIRARHRLYFSVFDK